MRARFVTVACLILVVLASPVWARSHAIEVWGELRIDRPLPAALPLAVYLGPEVRTDDLYRDIGAGMTEYLHAKGLNVTSDDEAEMLLVFNFGTRKTPHEERLRGYRAESSFTPSHRDYSFTHYFVVLLVDAGRLRDKGEVKVVWKGQAILADRVTENPGGESDERALAILGLLSKAALEYFGETHDWTMKYYKAKQE